MIIYLLCDTFQFSNFRQTTVKLRIQYQALLPVAVVVVVVVVEVVVVTVVEVPSLTESIVEKMRK